MSGLQHKQPQAAAITSAGIVRLGTQTVGRVDGFVFTPKQSAVTDLTACLADAIRRRADAVVASADTAFTLNDKGQIIWRDAVIGQLTRGESLHTPKAKVTPSPLLQGKALNAVRGRLQRFANGLIKNRLGELHALTHPKTRKGKAKPKAKDKGNPSGTKALTHTIAEILFAGLGIVPRRLVFSMLSELDDKAHLALARWGVRVGVDTVYMPDMLKPDAVALRCLLFSIYHNVFPQCGPPYAGRVAFDHVEGVSDDYWLVAGYRRVGARVMRVDMLERLLAEIRIASRNVPPTAKTKRTSKPQNPSKPNPAYQRQSFTISDSMLALAGASRQQMADILHTLGYVKTGEIPAENGKAPPIPVFMRCEKRNKPATKPRPNKLADKEAKPLAKSRAPSAGDKPQAKPKSKPRQKSAQQARQKPHAQHGNGKHPAKLGKPQRHKNGSLAKSSARKKDRALGGEIGKVITVGPMPGRDGYTPDSPFAVLAEWKQKQK